MRPDQFRTVLATSVEDGGIKLFAKNQKGEYYAGVESRRQMMLSLLRATRMDTPLSPRQLASDSKVTYSFVVPNLANLVKAGIVKPKVTAPLTHIQHQSYGLTNLGIELALSVSYRSKGVQGLNPEDYKLLIQKVSQPDPKDSPIQVFFKIFNLNLVHRNMVDFVLEGMTIGNEELERTGSVTESQSLRLWTLQNVIQPEKLPIIVDCINATLANMREDERVAIMRIFKNWVSNILFKAAIDTQDREALSLAVRSESDPNTILVPTVCKCGEMQRTVALNELAAVLFAGAVGTCSVCKTKWRLGYKSVEEAQKAVKEFFPELSLLDSSSAIKPQPDSPSQQEA